MPTIHGLYTAQELEELLGSRYFYRQRIYRLAERDMLSSYQVKEKLYFSRDAVEMAILHELAQRIRRRFPWLPLHSIWIHSRLEGAFKQTIIYMKPQKKILASVNPESETEEDLLSKLEKTRKEVKHMPDIPVSPSDHLSHPKHHDHHKKHGHHPHGHDTHGPRDHHKAIMDMLHRIENSLRRIEERLG